MTTVGDVLGAVDILAPFRLAEPWDHVGLILGDAEWRVRRILVSLGVSEAVVAEAERVRAEALLVHHPLLFSPVDRLTGETPAGRLAVRLLGTGRALIAAHTNLDGAKGGLCDLLAQEAGLQDIEPLHPAPEGKRYKVVVFLPKADLEAVRAAAFGAGAGAGAGRIGEYAECGFSVEGMGTFRPSEKARPAAGTKRQRNAVSEHRLEFVVEEGGLGAVVAAVGRAHSYEEPAIDIYPLHPRPSGAGAGRIGRFAKPRTPAKLAAEIRRALGAKAVRVAGPNDRPIERMAVGTGGGGGLVEAVAASGCQAYLTGELKYHEVEDLAARGVTVVLGGHYRTERVPLEAWAGRLAEGLGVEVRMSEAEEDCLRPG